MRFQPVTIRKNDDGLYEADNVVAGGYGFRIRPLFSDGTIPSGFMCPGLFPLKVTVESFVSDPKFLRGPIPPTQTRELWIRDDSWIPFPHGFKSLSILAPDPQIPFVNAEIGSEMPISYGIDIADSNGEKVEGYNPLIKSFQAQQAKDLQIDNALTVEPSRAASAVTPAHLFGQIGGIQNGQFYIAPNFKGFSAVLYGKNNANDVHIWQTVANGNGFHWALAEIIPASEWVANLADATYPYSIVLNRDCSFANQWIVITSGSAVAGVVRLAQAVFTFEA